MLVNPKLSGIFDCFSNLDNLSIDNIARFLSFKIEDHALENFIANRILYAQTVPMTREEMEIDLGLLREAVRINFRSFYTRSRSSLTIPADFETRFPPLIKLISALAGVFALSGVTKLFVRSWVGNRLVGSIVTPPLDHIKAPVVALNGQNYDLKPNSVTRFPVEGRHIELRVGSLLFDAAGGRYGLFVDLRGGITVGRE